MTERLCSILKIGWLSGDEAAELAKVLDRAWPLPLHPSTLPPFLVTSLSCKKRFSTLARYSVATSYSYGTFFQWSLRKILKENLLSWLRSATHC